MKILNFPFSQSAQINISNDSKLYQIECELAASDVEIFQSLNYRKEKYFKKPLALKFSNPLAKSFSKQFFDFPVEQIVVDYKNNTVKSIATIYPSIIKSNKNTNDNLISYSACSLVILAPRGLTKSKNIQVAKTKISM
jgi:uncharacterized membrane protein (UPF0127 family)